MAKRPAAVNQPTESNIPLANIPLANIPLANIPPGHRRAKQGCRLVGWFTCARSAAG
jgi:hypothetical protein